MQEERDQELVRAFHLMWDHFPAPCSLINKKREVIAVNPATKAIGREVGMICSKHGPPEMHKGCLASDALNSHETKQLQAERGGKKITVFWLPIDGYDEYYVHFAVAGPE